MTARGQGKQHGVSSGSSGEPPGQSLLLPEEHLLVLLERNSASGLLLPMAGLPMFQAIIPQWPHAPTIRLEVLS